MAKDTDMKAVGGEALGAIRDWVKEQTPTVDDKLNEGSANAIQNKAVAAALKGYVTKEDAAGYMGAVLKITFDGNFAGQQYTVTGGSESLEGTVPEELTVSVTVRPEGLTEYTISATAAEAEEANTATQEIQYFGVYPVTLTETKPVPFENVSWAEGTDEQIVALLAAAENGQVDLARDCNWKVGDVREVHLGAMAATGVGEAHDAQTVKLVLSHAGATAGISRADGGTIHFQVDQVHSLNKGGYMNSSNTNAGSWDGCARRAWCNDVYYNAIPETLRPIFKKMKVTTAEEHGSSQNKESEDFFALRAEKEIFGTHSYSNQTEFDALEQVEWYKTTANHKKNLGSSASGWWERSPNLGSSTSFCYVNSSGGASYNSASSATGLAPFGCI